MRTYGVFLCVCVYVYIYVCVCGLCMCVCVGFVCVCLCMHVYLQVAGFSDLPAQKAFQERLEAGKVKHDFFLYPGVGHAFTNSKGQNFNKEACDLSFSRMVEFFRKNLA